MKPISKISEDEIIRDWSLSPVDISFVRKFKKQYHLWIYLQVCALKLLGQLLENPNNLNSRIIGHACKTLGLAIIGTVKIPSRDATRTDYKKQIFEHLHFKQFNETKPVLHRWLTNRVRAGINECCYCH